MRDPEYVEVLVVGAGLSGVAAGYYLQTYAPDRSYAILEARSAMGGTWDQFRFPGIRSDSDMYTLGYSFRPWRGAEPIAQGADILQYIKDTAAAYGIDRKIRYGHRVLGASWSSETSRWTVRVELTQTGETVEFSASFLLSCAGYFDYEKGYDPHFDGRDEFAGPIVHPQFWGDDVDCADKKVVIIGSGATAVTLVPALAETAEKVTMLQRSPSYVLALPLKGKVFYWLRDGLPQPLGPMLLRWMGVVISMGVYQYCQAFPRSARKLLMDAVRQHLPEDYDVDRHFNPRYDPWDQRLCLVPEGDLFKVIRAGKADIETDHIERFTRNGILLRSGKELPADVIVTATGLKIRVVGGIEFKVDGRVVQPSETMCYRGIMFSDVPNFAMVIGYTTATWTLKCELVLRYVTRLLDYMDKRGYRSVVPEQNDSALKEGPSTDLTAGYLLRAQKQMPRYGSKRPWKLPHNYLIDRLHFRLRSLDDGTLKFSAG